MHHQKFSSYRATTNAKQLLTGFKVTKFCRCRTSLLQPLVGHSRHANRLICFNIRLQKEENKVPTLVFYRSAFQLIKLRIFMSAAITEGKAMTEAFLSLKMYKKRGVSFILIRFLKEYGKKRLVLPRLGFP